MGKKEIKKPKRVLKLKRTDIKDIKNFVNELSDDDWNSWSLRQKVFFVHRNTKSYPLIWSEGIVNNKLSIYKKNRNSKIWEFLKPEFNFLEKKYKGTIVKCMLANLLPNSKIDRHWDSNISLVSSHRLHLPIKTNSSVDFYVDDKLFKFKEGIWYEINNQKYHYVDNRSSENRIHLIVDILPFETEISIHSFCD
jgi:hypothetical protein